MDNLSHTSPSEQTASEYDVTESTTSRDDVSTMMTSSNDASFYYELARLVFVVADPMLLIVGLLGNVLMLVTVQRKKMRRSPVSVYISAMAVSDALVLIMDFLNNWLKMSVGIKLISWSTWSCKLYRFFFVSLYSYASWTVVAVSIERLIVVCFPFLAKTICTRKNATLTVAIMAVPIIVINLFHLWTFYLDFNGNCEFSPEHYHFQSQIAPWITGSVYSYIPVVILIVCNAIIIVTLTRQAKAREDMTGKIKDDQNEAKVTRVVIVICVTYLILTTPTALYYAVQFGAGEFVYQGPEMALAEAIILIIGLSHYAINFFLYIISSTAFRSEFLSMIGCGKNGHEMVNDGTHTRGSSTAVINGISSVSMSVSNGDD